VQLSFVLQAVFAQQLLTAASGSGRTLACEVLIANSAVKNLIREQKIEQINTVIQTGGKHGMVTMNQALVDLYKRQKITYQEAVNRSADPEDLKKLLQKTLSTAG
jgi:twitching motility protein PilT